LPPNYLRIHRAIDKEPLSSAVKRKVLTKTAGETPPNATHWSVRFDGESSGDQPHERAAHLGRSRAQASPDTPVQDLERPAV
jgi:hypothetical protein